MNNLVYLSNIVYLTEFFLLPSFTYTEKILYLHKNAPNIAQLSQKIYELSKQNNENDVKNVLPF